MTYLPSGDFVLPCTCEIWSDRETVLREIRQALNDACKAKNLGIVCRNVSASATYETLGDLVGAWALEVSDAAGSHLAEDNGDLQCFLRMVKGEVLGVAPTFVWVSVILNHSHRELV